MHHNNKQNQNIMETIFISEKTVLITVAVVTAVVMLVTYFRTKK